MSDVMQPQGQAPAQPNAEVKKEQTAQPSNQQSTSAPNSAGAKASPASSAIDEVMKTLPGQQAAESEELEDDGSDLGEEEVKKAEKAIQKLKKKLKVGGKEIEVDEDELVKRAQMGYSAQEKWEEAAKMRKQMEGFIGLLQKDPAAALEKMGFDVDALAEARIQQRIEEMKKTPEQLELERLRREHESILAERQREREELQTREIQRMQDEFAVKIESEIDSALNSPEFGLPKSPFFIKRIADVLIYDIQKNGKQTLSARQAAEVVRDEAKNELQQLYSLTPDEVFEQLVGKDRLNKYRRSKIKKKPTQAPPAPLAEVKATGAKELNTREEKPAKKILARDFFKNLGSK